MVVGSRLVTSLLAIALCTSCSRTIQLVPELADQGGGGASAFTGDSLTGGSQRGGPAVQSSTGGSFIVGGTLGAGGVLAQTGGVGADLVFDSGMGTGGADDDAGLMGGDPPPCVTDPNQVIIIGDSYTNWVSHSLPADLAAVSGQTWRLYGEGGASMATGGVATLIPDQFANAVAENADIKAVVMDGGGNDILVPDVMWFNGGNCKNDPNSPNVQVCKDIIQAAVDRAYMLMDEMVAAGVRDVIYFFYPHVPNNTTLGGTAPNAILDYAFPIVRDVCDNVESRTNGALRCHFVDMIPVFDGHADYFTSGDIHPSFTGSAAMAAEIWNTMTTQCVAQPASSGCCIP